MDATLDSILFLAGIVVGAGIVYVSYYMGRKSVQKPTHKTVMFSKPSFEMYKDADKITDEIMRRIKGS